MVKTGVPQGLTSTRVVFEALASYSSRAGLEKDQEDDRQIMTGEMLQHSGRDRLFRRTDITVDSP